MSDWLLFAIVIICFVLGLIFLWRAHVARSHAGLPSGKIIYADISKWSHCKSPLYSPNYHLSGRPDYLVRNQGRIIPVEVKSTIGLARPRESHVLQLFAYCLLVEETFGSTPPYGLLHYPDATHRLPYTPLARARIVKIIAQMRQHLAAEDLGRDHSDPVRCQACGFRSVCSQSL